MPHFFADILFFCKETSRRRLGKPEATFLNIRLGW